MGSSLDLPIERQRELAVIFGYGDDLTKWRKYMQECEQEFEDDENEIEEDPTQAEIAQKIHDLETNPYAIEYYRRITDNYDLTVEQQIKHLRNLKTKD
ncbi:hypothetical protein FW755_11030 [Lonepinella koalarum]|uniref:Uncharacterized protein n=1 Tax=Lonepinella koalarum TaxID=53417 RepID=A0A4R1KSU0_9PAST|nr:hypothetical protein [Lonepinella koalarum]MDH2927234.1 hypothetical protein [Lonepinella koalarum]TCK68094.1 hypothetical protein EV692_1793 [Lonepinella koalarum]TFJ89503.1 hypothetical protein E0709_09010 [Lonepinella koalarum]TYG33460.1 hypothetical protein FW755_11030 [Lonepinella koalarum]